jgi:hypothetical protein
MGKFKLGESGNPRGKPRGALHRATRAAQELLDGEAQELTRRCIELAKEGNPLALKLCLERLIPTARERPLSLKLPRVKGPADLPKALRTILEAAAAGEITPGEGQALTAMIEVYRKGLELADIEARVTALEQREVKHGKP